MTHVAGQNFAVQQFRIRGMLGDSPNVYPIFNKNRGALDGADIFCSPENARLIAAAPDFYEWATKTIERAHRGTIFLDCEELDELRSIVAKVSPSTTADSGVAE